MKETLLSLMMALTTAQVDRIIELGFAIVTVFTPLSSALAGYLIWRQHQNKKDTTAKLNTVENKIDENTNVSKVAFDTANGHNEKLAQLNQQVLDLAKKMAENDAKTKHLIISQPSTPNPSQPSVDAGQ